jgi:hypothetical protein
VSFTTGLVGNVFLVRWHRTPGLLAARELCRQVEKARASAGQPLIFCSVLTELVGPPTPDLRAHLGEVVASIKRHTLSMNIILCGNGVGRSLLRTLMRGAMVAARQTGSVRIVDDLESALARHASDLPSHVATVVTEARRLELIP